MVGEIGGHSGRAAEGAMHPTEVIHRAGLKHGGLDLRDIPRRRARPPGQGRDPGAKGAIQALNEGRIEHPTRHLGGRNQSLGGLLVAIGQGAFTALIRRLV